MDFIKDFIRLEHGSLVDRVLDSWPRGDQSNPTCSEVLCLRARHFTFIAKYRFNLEKPPDRTEKLLTGR